jgi:hypothetical protein
VHVSDILWLPTAVYIDAIGLAAFRRVRGLTAFNSLPYAAHWIRMFFRDVLAVSGPNPSPTAAFRCEPIHILTQSHHRLAIVCPIAANQRPIDDLQGVHKLSNSHSLSVTFCRHYDNAVTANPDPVSSATSPQEVSRILHLNAMVLPISAHLALTLRSGNKLLYI